MAFVAPWDGANQKDPAFTLARGKRGVFSTYNAIPKQAGANGLPCHSYMLPFPRLPNALPPKKRVRLCPFRLCRFRGVEYP